MIWIKLTMKGCKHMYIGDSYRAKVNDIFTADAVDEAVQKICVKGTPFCIFLGTMDMALCDLCDF